MVFAHSIARLARPTSSALRARAALTAPTFTGAAAARSSGIRAFAASSSLQVVFAFTCYVQIRAEMYNG